MMTLEEMWENLRQDPEIKATMEEVDKSYKLFKKIENLIVSDLEAKLAESEKTIRLLKMSNDALREDNLDLSYNQVDNVYETATEMSKGWEEQYQEEIAQLKQQLEESEKKFVVANNLRKKSDEVLLNYKTEKYGLEKTIQELREMKLSLPEKEWYYKGFENCERQMSSHIADLTLEVKELKQQLAEKEKEASQLYPFVKEYHNGIFVEYNVIYERDGVVATTTFGRNKEMAYDYLKSLKGDK